MGDTVVESFIENTVGMEESCMGDTVGGRVWETQWGWGSLLWETQWGGGVLYGKHSGVRGVEYGGHSGVVV